MRLSNVILLHPVREPGGHNLTKMFLADKGWDIVLLDGMILVTRPTDGRQRAIPIGNVLEMEPVVSIREPSIPVTAPTVAVKKAK